MKELTIKEIAKAVHGEIILGDENHKINSVCTDSRLAKKDSLFVPIIGEIHDGHQFIKSANETGATAFFTARKEAVDEISDADVILVKDTTVALMELASYYLKLIGPKVLAVTGSVGKTSTRDISYAILSTKYKTGKTLKNYNNDIGVPLTIFSFEEDLEAAVLEVGMDRLGDIHRLVNAIRPQVGIITNVGVSHLEYLETRENIRAAKMEITDYFGEGNTLVINQDNDMLQGIDRDVDYKIVNVGTTPDCQYFVHDVVDKGLDGISYKLTKDKKEYLIELNIPGAHNALNSALAIAACYDLGVSIEEAAKGLKELHLTDNRLCVKKANGLMVIDDTYNAAPDSMKSAINTLLKSEGKRKVAILGGMNELGTKSALFHKEVGQYAGNAGVDLLIGIEPKALDIAEGGRETMAKEKVLYFEHKEDFYREMNNILKEGDTILVKASRSMMLEELVDKIVQGKEEK